MRAERLINGKPISKRPRVITPDDKPITNLLGISGSPRQNLRKAFINTIPAFREAGME